MSDTTTAQSGQPAQPSPAAAGRRPQTATRAPRTLNPSGEKPFLEVAELKVQFPTEDGLVTAVSDLSYQVPLGRTLAIVGESGSGKSVSSMAVMGLHDPKRTRISGSIKLDGEELVGASSDRLRAMRGDMMSMIFQDPQSSLHPYFKVGRQLSEAYRVHHKVGKSAARKRALEMLELVGIPNPQRRLDQYPHEFSGGMRQRVMIAMALCNNPKLLFADEPTTALDVTVQAQILELLASLQKEFGSAIVLITHDLGVVAEVADDVLVMYAGRAVEYGTAHEVLVRPTHPYTWGLLQSIPTVSAESEELRPIKGAPPSLINLPSGCSFHPRCPYRERGPGNLCRTEVPPLVRHTDAGNASRCHLQTPDLVFQAEVEPGLD